MYRIRGCNCLLVLVMLLYMVVGLLIPSAQASSYSDISKHWAKNDIEFVSGQGIIAGYSDNTFRPDRNVTRAEYIAMINRTFRLSASIPSNFTDVKTSDWFAAEIGKARAAGYISGYSDGTIRPQKSITRQEAASMIAKILGLSSSSQTSIAKFKDKNNIGSWSLDAVAAVVNQGYMGGYPDNTFRPTSFIKRAEAAVVMRAVYGSRPGTSAPTGAINSEATIFDQAGTYGPVSGQQINRGDVNITAAGVTLRNTSVSGDLLIDRSVGNGSVILSNVVVQGTLKVEGGGPNSVVLQNSNIPDMIVSKAGVRVVAEGSTDINRLELTSGATLEESSLSGTGFEVISITSTGGVDVNLSGNFDSVTVSASADIAILSGSRIANLTLNSSASVTGRGTIGTANINASGVNILQTPDNTLVAANISASVGGETVKGTTSSSPPVFKSGYPKATNIRDTYFDLVIKTDESGRVYYVVLGNGDKIPTSRQVRNGENGNGTSLSSSRRGNTSITFNTEASIHISSLTKGTSYDIYVVAEDNDGNLQSSPARVDVTASGSSSAPEFYSGFPKKNEVTSTTLEFFSKIDKDGKIYYVVLPSYSSTPTPSQVKAGTNASGSSVSSSMKGTISLNKDTQDSEVVYNLSASTSYTLYAVAEDDNQNLQTTVKSFDFTTLSSNACTLAFSSNTASVAENATTITITVNRTGTISESARVHYSTTNGTAAAGSDYYATSGYLDWASGVTGAKTFTVLIINDVLAEGPETFTVTLDTPSGASLGTPSTITVTLTDDEVAGAGTLAFSENIAVVNENIGSVPLTVTRTGGGTGAASVQFNTSNGSATDESDYTRPSAPNNVLSWSNGDISSKTINIPIINDTLAENNESFTVILSNVSGATLGAPSTITVTITDNDAQVLALSTANPADATQDVSYVGHTFTATGGTSPYTFTMTAGNIPGMTLSSAGVLSGTPTVAANYSITITVSDSATPAHSVSRNYNVTVKAPISTLALNAATPSDAVVNQAYSYSFTATGGTTPYSYSCTGSLPSGLSLASSGVLAGTPTNGGSFSFTVTVTDNAGASKSLGCTLNVNNPPLLLGAGSPGNGVKDTVYSAYQFTASGGTGVYSYIISSGSLPPGLGLTNAGLLSGTPTASGDFSFSVTVTDSAGATKSGDYSINVS